MKLLSNKVYEEIEKILYNANTTKNQKIKKSIEALNNFFKSTNHIYFLNIYYYNRDEYKNRYSRDSLLFKYICRELHIEEPTLYLIKKEVIYKAAMIFYKNGVI